MKYTHSTLCKAELQNISDVLELINYRPRTIDSYLQSIFECCIWLQETYGISMKDADIPQLRAFLLHLKRTKEDGGLGYAPRSVNIYNCALKKYFLLTHTPTTCFLDLLALRIISDTSRSFRLLPTCPGQ